MKEWPLVTVCHLCYNNAHWIVESAQSVRASTYPNIQHIIIDDCSQDDSWETLTNYVQSLEDGAITLLRHETNRGIPAGHNHGVELARGKYFFGAVSDDIVMPKKLMDDVRLLEGLEDDEVVGVFSLAQKFVHSIGDRADIMGYRFKDGWRQSEGKISIEEMTRFLSDKNFIPAPTVILKTEWLKSSPYDTSYFLEDYPKWVDMCLAGRTLWFREATSMHYRRSESSFSNTNRQDKFRLRVIQDGIRCKMRLHESLGHRESCKMILRNDGIILLRSHSKEMRAWVQAAIAERNWRGALYAMSRFTTNRYMLRLAWFVSIRTSRI